MSLVMTAGWWPRRISAGTSASISAVLPEPTGPPTPTRCRWSSMFMRFLSSWVVMSAGKELGLGQLVSGRHRVGQRGTAPDVVQAAAQRGVGGLLDRRRRAADERLGAAVVGQAQAQGGARERGAEREQVGCHRAAAVH